MEKFPKIHSFFHKKSYQLTTRLNGKNVKMLVQIIQKLVHNLFWFFYRIGKSFFTQYVFYRVVAQPFFWGASTLSQNSQKSWRKISERLKPLVKRLFLEAVRQLGKKHTG